ncbi:MAG: hypothetical protein ACRDRO_14710 [Pseudonocardiaceae bacterium]
MFFRQILRAYQDEFMRRIQELAGESAIIEVDKNCSFRNLPLGQASELSMVDLADLNYWTTNEGKAYLRRQKDRIVSGQRRIPQGLTRSRT